MFYILKSKCKKYLLLSLDTLIYKVIEKSRWAPIKKDLKKITISCRATQKSNFLETKIF